jgi:hypothetical protein
MTSLCASLAWVWLDGSDRGRLWGERPLLLLGWLLPFGGPMIWNLRIIDQAKLQLGPLIILGCLVLALVRLKKYGLKE